MKKFTNISLTIKGLALLLGLSACQSNAPTASNNNPATNNEPEEHYQRDPNVSIAQPAVLNQWVNLSCREGSASVLFQTEKALLRVNGQENNLKRVDGLQQLAYESGQFGLYERNRKMMVVNRQSYEPVLSDCH